MVGLKNGFSPPVTDVMVLMVRVINITPFTSG